MPSVDAGEIRRVLRDTAFEVGRGVADHVYVQLCLLNCGDNAATHA
jgi:hypothetical protein